MVMSSELRRLEEESTKWFEENGHKGYYSHECPGYMEEHNRQIRIRQLCGAPPAHKDPNPRYGSTEYWDRMFPVDL